MPFRGNRISEEDAGRIVEEHYDDVLAYCRRHAPSWDEAYDATQETFLRFIRSLPSYQDQGKPLAFLLTIARGVCIDACRRQSASCEPLRDDIPSPQDGKASDLHMALGELPPEQREVLELRYDQGLRVYEVARVLGISRFSAARRISAALEALRSMLGIDDTEGGAL